MKDERLQIIFKHFGVEVQADKLIEEMDELGVELIEDAPFDRILEETADVFIMLNQFIENFEIDNALKRFEDFKLTNESNNFGLIKYGLLYSMEKLALCFNHLLDFNSYLPYTYYHITKLITYFDDKEEFDKMVEFKLSRTIDRINSGYYIEKEDNFEKV